MARSGLLAIAIIAVVMAVSFPEGMWNVLILCFCVCVFNQIEKQLMILLKYQNCRFQNTQQLTKTKHKMLNDKQKISINTISVW